MPSNTTRIAKNTLMLYFRQMLLMLVSLYTVRVVLNTLGTVDYGIYNVVAGVVTMFGFLSNSMVHSTQRFLSFEIGRGDFEQLKRVFGICSIVYVLIAIIITLLAETVGLWFVNHKLLIPPLRMDAARWIYQFSILSFIFTILASPFTAAILAHEDMNIYAVLSIIRAALNLGIAILIQYVDWDKLKLYGMLLSIVIIMDSAIYMLICKIKYSECSLTFFWDKRVFKEIITYNSWTLLGTFSNIFRNQVINILLNQFFNPVVVASRSIASQVSAAVSSFYLNFNVALRPSITKTYASSQHEKMISLIFDGTKGTFFLMYIFILPLMVEMPFVLSLWLKNVPEYAIQFSRLTLIDVFVWSINYPIDAAAMATKKIGLHIFVFSVALLMNFPATWIAFSLNAPAYSTMVIIIITSITAFSLRFFVIKKIIDFPMAVFLKTVLLPLGIVTALSSILPVIVLVALHEGFLRLCLSIITSIISITISMYFIGINTTDRKLLGEFVRRRFFQKK